ncbi:MAG: DUF4249 domain-containing protein [Bacteroidales bacterium]|nr:DUF4249 domain-containing protein [Bacteroidales bacterium]MDD4362265.1 DUF4249 domain-containing protein [Bacteroidales bacterium]
MKKVIVYLTVFLLFAACEKDIEFKGDITEPLLVLNGFARPDSLLVFRLTASKFFLEEADSFATVKDANLRLYVDGTYKEDLQSQQNGYYFSSYRPQQGDVLSLEAEAAGFEPIVAETLLPVKAELIGVDTSITNVGEQYALAYTYDEEAQDYIIDTLGVYTNYQVSIILSFRDPLASADYYRVLVKQSYGEGDEYYEFYNFNIDNFYTAEMGDLFSLTENQNDYHIYSDELFNGKEVDMKLSFGTNSYYDYQRGFLGSSGSFQIQLQNLSPSYYLYLKTLSEYQNTMEFFAEPIQIFTNVRNGIGLFGAYSSHVIELEFESSSFEGVYTDK